MIWEKEGKKGARDETLKFKVEPVHGQCSGWERGIIAGHVMVVWGGLEGFGGVWTWRMQG